VIVVGINPSSARSITAGSTLARVHRWMTYCGETTYDFTNVVLTPGDYSRGMVDFGDLSRSVSGYERVVALGDFVSYCLMRAGVDHYVAPHPSGRNRKMNDQCFVTVQIEGLRAYLEVSEPLRALND